MMTTNKPKLLLWLGAIALLCSVGSLNAAPADPEVAAVSAATANAVEGVVDVANNVAVVADQPETSDYAAVNSDVSRVSCIVAVFLFARCLSIQ